MDAAWSLNGCFNTNTRLPDGGGLFRRPLPSRWNMHARQFDERAVLHFLQGTPVRAPRVLGDHDDGFIMEFIEGQLLEQVTPPGQPVAPVMLDMLAHTLRSLHHVPHHTLGAPFGTDTRAFAHRLVDGIEQFMDWSAPWSGEARRTYRVPADPLAPLRVIADGMTPRLPVLVHGDFHRRNAILQHDGVLALIDWEFALIGDPVYDLARHVMLMDYTQDEAALLLQRYAPNTAPACHIQLGQQLAGYRSIETIKETLVLVAVIGENTATAATHERLSQLLPHAHQLWAA